MDTAYITYIIFRTICEDELHKYKELLLHVLLGWDYMPHCLANLRKAEVKFAAHPQ